MMRYSSYVMIGLLVTLQTAPFAPSLAADKTAESSGSRPPLQSDSSQSGTSQQSEAPTGGAAMADFSTLMNLIENTIDPDSWLSAGGTSAMLPYPAGVWIDPRGRLDRRTPVIANQATIERLLQPAGLRKQLNGPTWHGTSPLRMVSLRQLDELLFEISKNNAVLSPEVIRLAGLNQVRYVLIDGVNKDIILAGPANGQQNGFFLEDLAVVTGLIGSNTQSFGCSIEPVQENILQTQEYIATPQAQKLLSQSPQNFAKRLDQLMGSHEAQVFGMQSRTSTAVALLAADVSMKELGFGKSDLPLRLRNYFDFLEQEAVVPKQSLIRWWFDYADQPLTSNQDQTLFQLPDQCVCLFSQQQFLTLHGRQSSGKSDPAADAFAFELNRHLAHLRELDPSYSRMCCVFEVALALQVSLIRTELNDFLSWFPTLCGLGQLEQEFVQRPQLVDGLVASRQLQSSRTNIAVVSGGVQIDPRTSASRTKWHTSPHLSGSTVPLRPSDAQAMHWWWD